MVFALLLALFVGLSLGLLGGGGSILTLPILVYVVGLETKDGIVASLFVVGTTSASAMLGHARSANVRWGTGAIFGVSSMAGAFVGGRLSRFVPSAYLLGGFTFVMLVTAFAMMRPRREVDAAPVSLRGGALARALAAGVGIGLVTGFVGAGGGFVIVPALALLCGLSMRAAVGTSLLVITMNSAAGFAGAASHASIPWGIVGAMTLSAVIGSFAGAALAGRVTPATLRKGFAWFVLVMAVAMISKQVPLAWLVKTPGYGVAAAVIVVVSSVAALFTIRQRQAAAHGQPDPSEPS